MATMQTAIFEGTQQIRIASLSLPEPGPQEVRVRLEGCGVCASNIPLWEGRQWFNYPLPSGAPGHEGWGRIDALGEGVEGLTVGERVALWSTYAYAEYEVVQAQAVIPLPASLDALPYPGEALGCAINIWRRSAIQPGENVAIIGIGFLGALLTSLGKQAGAHVIAISRREYALEVAHRCGADITLRLDDPVRVGDQVKGLTRDLGCDCVIEATGKQEPLDLASELTRTHGRLIIAGYHQDGPRQVNMQLWNWRGLDVINAHERRPEVILEGMRAAVAAVAQGTFDLHALCTHSYPLEHLSTALAATQERPEGFLKACITYA